MALFAILALSTALGIHVQAGEKARCDLSTLERAVLLYPAGQPVKPLKCFRYVPGATSYLAGVLTDGARVKSWPMTVTVLGAIGDASSYDVLLAFLGSQRTVDAWGRMAALEFTAKVDAILMIDYVRRYSADVATQQRASALLNELVTPHAWRRYEWQSPDQVARSESDAYLAGKVRFALQRKRAPAH